MTNDKDGACPCWGTDKEVEQLRDELEAAQDTITALNKRVKEEEARANGIGNRIAKEKAEADCKRIRLERDRLRSELGAVTELLNAELINAQHCETLKAENAQLAAALKEMHIHYGYPGCDCYVCSTMRTALRSLLHDPCETISWALDLIEMYDRRLVQLGDPEHLVYSDTHKDGVWKARDVLTRLRELCEKGGAK